MTTARLPHRRIAPALALLAAGGAALAFASAASATTQCYRTDQHLVGRNVQIPPGQWGVAGRLTNRAALDLLVRGDMRADQGVFTFYTRRWKVVGVTRSDIEARPAQIESFVSQASIHAKGRGLSVGVAAGTPGLTGASVSVDTRAHSAASSAPTDGLHAVFRYPASAPFLAGAIGAGALTNPKLSVRVSGLIGIADGVGNQVFPGSGAPALDTARITLRTSQIKADLHHLEREPRVIGWTRISCRTGYDGKPPPKKKHRPSGGGGHGPAMPAQSPPAVNYGGGGGGGGFVPPAVAIGGG